MKFLFLSLILSLSASAVNAQTFYGGGLSFGSIVGDGYNGQDKQVGGFGEAVYSKKLGLRFDAAGLATLEYAPKDPYSGGVDFRARPELRVFAPIPKIAPFVGAGVQYSFFSAGDNGPFLGYHKSGLNYTGSVGIEIYGSHTVRSQRLFTDRTNLNANKLEGFRYGYDMTKRFSKSDWGIRFCAEYNRFKYIQPINFVNAGSYTGQSLAFRLGVVRIH